MLKSGKDLLSLTFKPKPSIGETYSV